MTLTEILQAQGLDDDAIKAVTAAMKENKVYTASEENLDIRYGKLKTDHEGTSKQLQEANALIEELKKSTKGQEGLQGKIAEYEQQIERLQAELQETKINAAIKVELLSSKAVDVDYLTYKLREKLKADGETLSLDETGTIKGWTDKLDGLKTQFPHMFSTAEGNKDGYQVLDPNKLQIDTGNRDTISKEAFGKMSYAERLKLYQENPDAYNQLNK